LDRSLGDSDRLGREGLDCEDPWWAGIIGMLCYYWYVPGCYSDALIYSGLFSSPSHFTLDHNDSRKNISNRIQY
jgi:hypothetical protein